MYYGRSNELVALREGVDHDVWNNLVVVHAYHRAEELEWREELQDKYRGHVLDDASYGQNDEQRYHHDVICNDYDI